ncbi:MAG: hypothetical protein J2P24_20660, partial [Streptosporangiales bacterium]|nr:hypothetical protein [Streptosporangiales bacterium]
PPANEHGDVTDPTQEGNLTNATATNRPMLGLRFGNTIYYDIHARAATRGRDAPAMIGNAAQQAHGGGHDWVVLGDFNRSPASLRRDIPRTYQSTTTGPTPIGRTVDGGGQGTHFSGNNLDYMVTNLDLGTDQYRGRVEDSRGGDHFPVTFRSLFGSVNDPYRLFHGNSSIDVDQNHTPGIGQVADPEDYYSIASTVGGGSEMLVDKRDGECFTDSDDDKVTEAPCDQDDPAQAFSVEKAPSSGPDDFWFRNRLANKCLSAAPITQQTPPYRGMYLGPCDRDAVLTYKRSDDDGQAHPPVFKRDAPPESDPKVPDSQGNQPPVQSQPENSDPPPAP